MGRRLAVRMRASALLLVLLALAGCGDRAASSADEAPSIRVTPTIVAGRLDEAADLETAVEQFADALGLPPELVRVRISASSCLVCNLEENREATSLAGISVAEAAERLQKNDELALFVRNFTCAYRYNGEQLFLVSCQYVPL